MEQGSEDLHTEYFVKKWHEIPNFLGPNFLCIVYTHQTFCDKFFLKKHSEKNDIDDNNVKPFLPARVVFAPLSV